MVFLLDVDFHSGPSLPVAVTQWFSWDNYPELIVLCAGIQIMPSPFGEGRVQHLFAGR